MSDRDLPTSVRVRPQQSESAADPLPEPEREGPGPGQVPSGEPASSGRDARTGRFTAGPGNRWALRHGGCSRYVAAGRMPEQAAIVAALADRQAEIEADQGGREHLSALARDLVRDYLQLRFTSEWLADNLIAEGALTAKGRRRAALTAYLQVLDRLHKIALALGLRRVPKRVPSLHELLAERADDEPEEREP